MMAHYVALKKIYQESLLFYRLGDFYELFFDDAKVASKELGLALTGRECGMPERAPMCGVPHHAAMGYIKRLVDKGYSVAICEQLSLPVKGKAMVDRDVVRVITPGTATDEDFLDGARNNFVAAVYMPKKGPGSIAWADVSTGQLHATEVSTQAEYLDTLAMINPREIISTTDFKANKFSQPLPGVKISDYYDYAFNPLVAHETVLNYFNIKSTQVFDFDSLSPISSSVGALLEYLRFTQKKTMANIKQVQVIKHSDHMVLDKTARDNLEITHQFRDVTTKKGSLLWVLDDTKTSMGARLLSRMVALPLQDTSRINQRLDAIELLVTDSVSCKELRELLSRINDISRLCGKIALRDVLPRDVLGLAKSLEQISELKKVLTKFPRGLLRVAFQELNPLPELFQMIYSAIEDTPPARLDDGGYIKEGFNKELDDLREIKKQGHVWLTRLEAKEREECNIKELRVGYNRIAGYYFEVPKRLSSQVPYRLIRIATTKDTERYYTEELKNLEQKIMGAENQVKALELDILNGIRDELLSYIQTIQKNAEHIAIVDVMSSLATVAIAGKWVRPRVGQDDKLVLKNVRHPVVEKILGANRYIANDCVMQSGLASTMIITGPNMAGKSTYMRSVALVALLAHVGSFVPATSATVPLIDRIFTRIGASDSLFTGQSTFMVECNEISVLLNNATKNSLLLLDEVGRGTGAQEGRALASAIITYITDNIGCMTMFATHFHELTLLAKDYPKIKNYRATAAFNNGSIVFLHKIEPGIEEKSFGIEVAKLAGIPQEVLDNARKLFNLDRANQESLAKGEGKIVLQEVPVEVPIEHPVISRLQDIDMNLLSPMEAHAVLGSLIKEVNQ